MKILLFGAASCLLAGIVVASRKFFEWLHRRFMALSRFQKVATVFFLCVCTVAAQKGGDDDGDDGEDGEWFSLPRISRMTQIGEIAVSDEDVVRGYWMENVTNRDDISYVMPEGAGYFTNWWRRGGYEDVRRIEIPPFPLGTNVCGGLMVYIWGKVRPRLRDAAHEIAAVGAPMGAVPQVSRFWWAADTNATLLTWQNFTAGRIPIAEFDPSNASQFVSAQIELYPNGDFVTRSNGVETAYRRINPDDWDGDGIPNEDDIDPMVWDGDNFGPHQILPKGANSNAYCWVDLVVSNADAQVEFTGDGVSDLDDPRFIAKAGEINRVTLLIGKTYRATSLMPITVVDRSNEAIEIQQEDESTILINWPVAISAMTRMRGGNGFNMSMRPDGLGGRFIWTNYCCSVSGSVGTFTYGCNGRCYCTGCAAGGYFQYEGYRLPATGGYCGCSVNDDTNHGEHEDEEPVAVGVSMAFTKGAILFEDEYENSDNEIVPWRSTETKLICKAYGGETGGVVRVEITGADDLIQYGGQPLPLTRELAAEESLCFTNTYRAVAPSGGENAIQATGTFIEHGTGWSETITDRATAIKLEFKPEIGAPENKCENRHKVGVREIIECRQYPSSPQVLWISIPGGDMLNERRYQCPLNAATHPLKAQYGGAEYAPNIIVVEPFGIAVSNIQVETYGVSTNYAGGVGMTIDCYVLPLDVSFAEIAVEEPPNSYYEASGYFADQAFAECWGHSTNMGAGVWCDVRPDNYCGNDEVAVKQSLPRVVPGLGFTNDTRYWWTEGQLVWATPSGWGEKQSEDTTPQLHKQFDEGQRQIFIISTNGTVEVRKFNNTVQREISDDIYLNGVKVEDQ